MGDYDAAGWLKEHMEHVECRAADVLGTYIELYRDAHGRAPPPYHATVMASDDPTYRVDITATFTPLPEGEGEDDG